MSLAGAVIRIRYRCTSEQARRVDQAALRGLCKDLGVHHLSGIAAEIVRSERARVAGVDEQVEPLDALGLWADANDLDAVQHTKLNAVTLRYLEETAA